MKRTSYIILALILALVIFNFVLILEAQADTHTAASCSYADILATVTASSPGDTVTIPAGSATWSNALTFTRGLTIIGSGAGLTNITCTGSTCISYTPDAIARSNNERFELSNMTLSGGTVGLSSNAVYLNNNGSETAITKVLIHDIAFNGAGITNRGDIFGVAYNNTFSGSDHYFYYAGNDDSSRGSSGCGSWIINTRTPGSANNFFYEDNIINLTNGTELAAYGQGYGGGIVQRYNTWSTNSVYIWDAHGNLPATGTSSQTMEIYGNAVAVGKGINILTDWRGGHIWMFWNKFTGGGTGTFRTRQEYCNSVQNCFPAIIQHISDTYFFNNRDSSGLMVPTTSEESSCNEIGWDLSEWKDSIPFNGTSGVGCGILASRPTICTPGVGYWATNQDCAIVASANVGKNPSTPISGTLYKCTAPNTWTAYYTPYTYPHPLRGSSQPPLLYGDISGDGTISAYDASLAAQYAVNLITLTPAQITATDVSGDGTVSAYDASLIAQKAVGLISKFPIEGG